MKKFLFFFFFTGTMTISMAQTTKEVHGAVIDKNGNPLSGAKVEATGGAESTITDADGTFTLEVSRWLKSVTATYPGMATKKMSLKNGNEILFNMRENNRHWFINAVYQRDWGYSNNAIGVMGGLLNNWGWYIKVLSDTEHHCRTSKYRDKRRADIPSISIGTTKRIAQSIHLYFGLGYTQCYDDNYYYGIYIEDGLIADLGLFYNYKHFNINLGVSHRRQFDNFFDSGISEDGNGLHLGIGYSF